MIGDLTSTDKPFNLFLIDNPILGEIADPSEKVVDISFLPS
jgi:hypothetical protein